MSPAAAKATVKISMLISRLRPQPIHLSRDSLCNSCLVNPAAVSGYSQGQTTTTPVAAHLKLFRWSHDAANPQILQEYGQRPIRYSQGNSTKPVALDDSSETRVVHMVSVLQHLWRPGEKRKARPYTSRNAMYV